MRETSYLGEWSEWCMLGVKYVGSGYEIWFLSFIDAVIADGMHENNWKCMGVTRFILRVCLVATVCYYLYTKVPNFKIQALTYN